jgi:hypothetical protein
MAHLKNIENGEAMMTMEHATKITQRFQKKRNLEEEQIYQADDQFRAWELCRN